MHAWYWQKISTLRRIEKFGIEHLVHRKRCATFWEDRFWELRRPAQRTRLVRETVHQGRPCAAAECPSQRHPFRRGSLR